MLSGGTCPIWSDDRAEHSASACFDAARAVWMQACIEAKHKPPDCRAIRKWHEQLFRDAVPLSYYAGNFRQEDARRVCLGINVGVNGSSAAPFQQVCALMLQFESEVAAELAGIELQWASLTPVERLQRIAVTVGIAVGVFIRIHPFINGNGRTSRLLWSVLLSRVGLPIEMAIVRRPAGNYGAAMAAAMKGDFGPAVALVIAGIAGMVPPSALSA